MTKEKMLSFVEHLVELRKRLIIVIIAIVIGMGVAWNVADDILAFIEKPLTGHTYLTELKKRGVPDRQGSLSWCLCPL